MTVSPAAHVSEDGRDLAMLTGQGSLFLVQDFLRICREEVKLEDIMIRLVISDSTPDERQSGVYLAFAHGRVGVALVRKYLHLVRLLLTVLRREASILLHLTPQTMA